MKTKDGKFWLVSVALLAALTLAAQAATVTVTVDPPDIALGDSTQLTVTVTGSQDTVTLPDIAGPSTFSGSVNRAR